MKSYIYIVLLIVIAGACKKNEPISQPRGFILAGDSISQDIRFTAVYQYKKEDWTIDLNKDWKKDIYFYEQFIHGSPATHAFHMYVIALHEDFFIGVDADNYPLMLDSLVRIDGSMKFTSATKLHLWYYERSDMPPPSNYYHHGG